MRYSNEIRTILFWFFALEKCPSSDLSDLLYVYTATSDDVLTICPRVRPWLSTRTCRTACRISVCTLCSLCIWRPKTECCCLWTLRSTRQLARGCTTYLRQYPHEHTVTHGQVVYNGFKKKMLFRLVSSNTGAYRRTTAHYPFCVIVRCSNDTGRFCKNEKLRIRTHTFGFPRPEHRTRTENPNSSVFIPFPRVRCFSSVSSPTHILSVHVVRTTPYHRTRKNKTVVCGTHAWRLAGEILEWKPRTLTADQRNYLSAILLIVVIVVVIWLWLPFMSTA